jgi:hypothetical protein
MKLFCVSGEKCVKILGECVFHYLLTHSRSRRTVAAGPPLHVECSSSGHFPPPRQALPYDTQIDEDRQIDHYPTMLLNRRAATHPPPTPQRKTQRTKNKILLFLWVWGGRGGGGVWGFYNFIA